MNTVELLEKVATNNYPVLLDSVSAVQILEFGHRGGNRSMPLGLIGLKVRMVYHKQLEQNTKFQEWENTKYAHTTTASQKRCDEGRK